MVVIATKFDKLCPKISENVDHLFKSPRAKQAVANIASFHGVNSNQVFPVVNYIDEEERLHTKDQLALTALYWIYKSIEGYLTHHPDRKIIPDNWKAREDVLPDWTDDAEKRNLVSEKLTPFDDMNLRILLVGPVDSGKSSFIDSVHSALCGKIAWDASIMNPRAMTDHILSTTEKFKLYPVDYVDRDTGAKRRSGIRLGDTPGFQEQDGIKEDHINSIISGNVADGYKIINAIQDTQEDIQRDQSPGDKMHCVCFVFDCEKVQKGLPENIKRSMIKLRTIIFEKACPHIVLLTKCDKVSNSLKTSRRRIFEDGNVRECKERLKAEFGFRQQQIYPIVNYDDQNDVDKQTDRLILAAFFEILDLGKTHMESAEGQEKE
ncbi:interferon-induced protein 44-like [Ruditapes philippinarum]|uniref:interferon-induced protein 44-like n=1 Tax=Ruditapes philippinarum TaxID=129788 RepID=UPI00295C265D|nr:interferon-induced protein 44-like [Ruditapes philippinarum]